MLRECIYSFRAKPKSDQVLVSLFAQSIIVVMAVYNLAEKITGNLIICAILFFVSDPVMKHETFDIPFSISFN